MAPTYDPATAQQVPSLLRPAVFGAPDPTTGIVPVSGDPNDSGIDPSQLKTPSPIPGGDLAAGIHTGDQPPPMNAPNQPAPDLSAGAPKPDTTPELKIGPKNKFLNVLSRLSGMTPASPPPGQKFTPPSTGDKLGTLGRFIGTLGAGLGVAAGTPQQKELSLQAAQFGPNMQERAREAQMNFASMYPYRQALAKYELGRNATTLEAAGIKAHPADMRAQLQALENGAFVDADGSVKPMTQDQIRSNPIAQAAYDLKTSQSELRQAQAYRASMQPGIESKALDEKIMALQYGMQMKERNLQMAGARLGLQQQALGMRGQEEMMNFGRNFLTGDELNAQNAPPGMLMDGSGQPMPLHMQGNIRPTGQARNISGQAEIAVHGIDSTIQHIQEHPELMGPMAGNWGKLIQGKLGAQDPAFAALQADGVMAATAVALAHARGRLPENLRQEFDGMIANMGQDPQNNLATLQTIREWMVNMSQMINMGVPNVTPGQGGGGVAPLPPQGPAKRTGGSKGQTAPQAPATPKNFSTSKYLASHPGADRAQVEAEARRQKLTVVP